MRKKEFLTVAEMARLVNIPITTLKHYERIGLLKPAMVNKETLYRYYSISQYEIIDIIKELRELNLSTAEIKKYLSNRSLEKSITMLGARCDELAVKIEELIDIKKNLEKQIVLLEDAQAIIKSGYKISEEDIPARSILSLGELSDDPVENHYYFLALEHLITGKMPTLARGAFGRFIPKDELILNDPSGAVIVFVFSNHIVHENKKYTKIIPGGKYVCLRYSGRRHVKDRWAQLQILLNYINEKGYRIIGDAIEIGLVDEMLTENNSEFVYEYQIPVSDTQ